MTRFWPLYDVEEEIYENVAWDLPGLTSRPLDRNPHNVKVAIRYVQPVS